MSKASNTLALGGVAVAAAVAVAVATGVISLPGQKGAPRTETEAERRAMVSPALPDAPAEPGAGPEAGRDSGPEDAVAREDAVSPGAEGTGDGAPGTETADDAPQPPRFDTVRAEPDGSALVAGTGAPESDIEVLVDGDATLSVTADRAGKFVAFLDLPRDSSGVTISLRMTPVGYSPGEAILSTQDVILAMPTRANAPVASASAEAALSQPGADSAAGVPGAGDAPAAEGVTVTMIEAPAREAAVSAPPMPAPGRAPEGLISSEGIAPSGQLPGGGAAPEAVASTGQVAVPERDDVPAVEAAAVGADVPEVAAAPDAPEALASGSAPGAVSAPEGEPEGQAAPEMAPVAAAGDPTVLVSGPQGIEALSDAPLPPGDVALDSISYDDAGDVLLAGRGEDASFVRVYLNNAPLATTRIREDGRWRLELPEVDTGTYTLRVDQVTEGGDVTARVESPFRREDPARLERLGADGRPISEITVQPGHTLWAISSARYGEGVQYVRIFEANRDHIRDPDLIYPGQIFDLPDDVAQVGSQ